LRALHVKNKVELNVNNSTSNKKATTITLDNDIILTVAKTCFIMVAKFHC